MSNATQREPIDSLTGIIKHTTGGKLVAEVKCDDCRYHGPAYVGDVVEINGTAYTCTGHGQKFGSHGNIRMYLYLDAPAAPQATTVCRHCGTYCYGDCQANR